MRPARAVLLEHLEAELCVDPRHVHATGFSHGGAPALDRRKVPSKRRRRQPLARVAQAALRPGPGGRAAIMAYEVAVGGNANLSRRFASIAPAVRIGRIAASEMEASNCL